MSDHSSPPLFEHIVRLAQVLIEQARENAEVREALAALGASLGELARDLEPSPPAEPEPPPAPAVMVEETLRIGDVETPVTVADGGIPAAPPSDREPLAASVPSFERKEAPAPSLRLVLERSHLKSKACRWAVERRRRISADDDFQLAIDPTDKQLVGEAKQLSSCYLWMLDPYGPVVEDANLEDLAECYENLAVAAEIGRRYVDEVQDEPDGELLQRIATIQSALYHGLKQYAEIGNDQDQLEMFAWLREKTMAHQIFIARHMKLDDPADPGAWHAHRMSLGEWQEQREDELARDRRRGQLIKAIQYHVRMLAEDRSSNPAHDWNKIVALSAEWVQRGFPASDKQITRELAVLEQVEPPDDLETTSEAQQVLDAVDRYIALRQRSTPAPTKPEGTPTEEVREVAGLLKDAVVILIGGDTRTHAKHALEKDFQLAELRWLETSSGIPLERIEGEIMRPEVALVMLAIRWSSHVFGNFADVAARADKPFVRLPGGYNPNQVAHQVLEQAGDRLREHDRQT